HYNEDFLELSRDMEAESVLYLQLDKLSVIKSEEELQQILSTLWRTRKTGLTIPDKSHLQSLLNLPSLAQVEPVSACLRSLIRKCVHENFTGDDMLKLFPPDLPLDLQSILVMSFQKYQNQWKEEMSREQHLTPKTSFSHPVNPSLPPALTYFPNSDISASLWPRQGDPIPHSGRNGIEVSTPIIAETNALRLPLHLQHDIGPPDNVDVYNLFRFSVQYIEFTCFLLMGVLSLMPLLATKYKGTLPRLKSMTWTLENRNKIPTNRVAVISLKLIIACISFLLADDVSIPPLQLQDYTKSPLGETEVKFQLTRETLEAMLRSMTYINEKLSSSVSMLLYKSYISS
ncbi:hypothetical protein RJ639_022947, partial [Escallonia herrerae]